MCVQKPSSGYLLLNFVIYLFMCLFVCVFVSQVMLLIDIELSYINTNHEDFIGFAK